MKQLLFLLLFPCLAMAQYPANGNQKISLGEQTTADGLVYRGLAADTTRKPSVDTMAYILLDTNTNIIWQYKKATNNAWTRVGGSISSGVTGVLPVANGGTNNTSYISGAIPFSNGTTLTSDTSKLFYDATNLRLGLGTSNTTLPFTIFNSNSAMLFQTPSTGLGGQKGFYVGHTGDVSYIYNYQNYPIQIATNNTPRMQILGNGDVGIGTVSPTEKLHVVGNARITGSVTATRFNANTTESGISSQYGSTNATNSYVSYIYNNSDIAYLGNGTSLFSGVNATDFGITTAISSNLIFGTNNLERMRIASGGEIYVAGTTDRGAYNLQVNGTGVWGEGAYVNGSDANIKENIVDLDSSLIIVNNLKPVIFNYIKESVNNDTKHLGFIAQDVYQTLVNKDYLNSIVRSDGDTLSIAYSNLIPLLTKAIQEQQALIKALEQRILILENK